MGRTSISGQERQRAHTALGRLAAVVLLIAAAVAATGGVAASSRPETIVIIVPGCVVDPADVLGWWRGDSTVAAIGPNITGTVVSAPGLFGQAFTFDGSSVASVDAFPIVSTGVTVEAWVKPTQTDTIQTLFSRWDFPSADDSARSYALFLLPDGRLIWSTDETSTRRPEEPSVVAPLLFDGDYHHVAATWDQSTVAVYIDGVSVLTVPSQGGVLNPAATTQFRLGSKAGTGSPFAFQGLMDEPSVIRRALTATEVINLRNAGPNGKCPPAAAPPSVPTVLATGASGATAGASARWKGANSGAEIFVGPMLPPSALPRAEAGQTWSPGTSFDVTMTHDAAANTLRATATGAATATATFDFNVAGGAPGCAKPLWNALDLLVVDSRTDAGLRVAAVTLDGVALGDIGVSDIAGTPGAQNWNVRGPDFSETFVLTARIEVAGAGFVGNEALRFQATVGCAP